jgi:23S rRNA (guanine745-N1)-methyltransferase
MSLGESGLRCSRRHSFDLARQGYVSLQSGAVARSGDDAAMAQARERFLDGGRYRRLRDGINEAVTSSITGEGRMSHHDPAVIDAGCGTGYYLAGLLDAVPGARGLGIDTSVRSLRIAARAHERAAAASWDVFRPFPLADRSVDVVLDVFSPRNPAEFARVLREDGVLVIARPAPDHLAELREQVTGMVAIHPEKEERLAEAVEPCFSAVRTMHVRYAMEDLAAGEVADLVGMTPSARHLGDGGTVVGAPRSVTVSVLVSSYRPR